MSSNVGLSTPRGSGTSGYVQRNLSLLKPRDSGYGAPYPPLSSASGPENTFKQRKPDQKILEHDRRRAIEVKILEERDRLEEENERIDGEEGEEKGGKKKDGEDGGDENNKKKEEKRVKLSEEEIEERLDTMRAELLRELEDEFAGRSSSPPRGPASYGYPPRDRWRGEREQDAPPKGRKQFKTYQVHELAEAKIQESERLRKALGIKGDGEEDGPYRQERGGRRWDDRGEREREKGRDHRDGVKDSYYRSSRRDEDRRDHRR
ncbi:hypothetical protein AJ80_04878 [Polytolypa hystricis UAMH7299]|uniref:CWF21 domain-containing protein n=1 Tax=Polytolypa hystricis (strain UAMH7299) TaxID=1447883 RepID=A0A2B7Y6U3_POLH7|nr:hypothetical protein AJ80_04878 [Polytolypa hystricis UAMH7299]